MGIPTVVIRTIGQDRKLRLEGKFKSLKRGKKKKQKQTNNTEKQSPHRPWGQLDRDSMNITKEFPVYFVNQMFEFPGIVKV